MKTVDFVELMEITKREKLTWVNLMNTTPVITGSGRNGRVYSWHGKYRDVYDILFKENEDKILVEVIARYKNVRIRELQAPGYICTTVCEIPDTCGDTKFDRTYYIAEKEVY